MNRRTQDVGTNRKTKSKEELRGDCCLHIYSDFSVFSSSFNIQDMQRMGRLYMRG